MGNSPYHEILLDYASPRFAIQGVHALGQGEGFADACPDRGGCGTAGSPALPLRARCRKEEVHTVLVAHPRRIRVRLGDVVLVERVLGSARDSGVDDNDTARNGRECPGHRDKRSVQCPGHDALNVAVTQGFVGILQHLSVLEQPVQQRDGRARTVKQLLVKDINAFVPDGGQRGYALRQSIVEVCRVFSVLVRNGMDGQPYGPWSRSDLRFPRVFYDVDGARHEAVHSVLESVKIAGPGSKVR